MQDEDFVETSDAEELEEQVTFKAFGNSPEFSSSPITASNSQLPSPRKRQKLFHTPIDLPLRLIDTSLFSPTSRASIAPSSPLSSPDWSPILHPAEAPQVQLAYPEFLASDEPSLLDVLPSPPPSSLFPPSDDTSRSSSLFESSPLIESQKPPLEVISLPSPSQRSPSPLPTIGVSTSHSVARSPEPGALNGVQNPNFIHLDDNHQTPQELFPRYALRRREIRQLKPYSLEFAEYKRSMKSHPEAIVKLQNPPDVHIGEDAISQHDYQEEPDDQVLTLSEDRGEHGGLLEELSSTDEDIRALSNEARQAMKRLREKKGGQKRVKGKRVEDLPLPRPDSPPSPRGHLENEVAPQNDSPALDNPSSEPEEEVTSGDQPLDGINRKGLRALKRMYPAGMLPKLTSGTSAKDLRKHDSAISAEHTFSPKELLPGQSKIRRSLHPPQIRQIRGDSESSDSDAPLQDLASPGPRRTPEPHADTFVPHEQTGIEFSDTSDNSSCVDDEDIQSYLHSEKPSRREDFIDWMLARTRTIGPRKVGSSSKPSRRRYHVDIAISRGYRNQAPGRQTVLNFQPKPPNKAVPNRRRRSSNADPDSHIASEVYDGQDSAAPAQLYSKSKRKRLHSLEPAKDVYIFTAARGTHIATGKSVRGFMSLDLADQEFREALAPVPRPTTEFVHPPHPRGHQQKTVDKPNHASHKKRKRNHGHPIHSSPEIEQLEIEAITPPTTRYHVSDMSNFPPGIAFPPTTAIVRGSLRGLLSILTPHPSTDQAAPSACNLQGISLHLEMAAEDFIATIPRICDGIFQLTTELPDEDTTHLQDWKIILRLSCQYLSWFLRHSDEEEASIRAVATSSASLLVTRTSDEIQSSSTPADESILLACWFSVEFAVRLDGASTHGQSDLIKSSLSLLVRALLSYDLRNIVECLADETIVDRSSSSHYAAEIWVHVIHLTNHLSSMDTGGPKSHILCGFIEDALRDGSQNIQGSEKLWCIIHGLTALSQFSVNGMTTTKATLFGCWGLVTRALHCVRLLSDAIHDKPLPAASLDKRDQYAGIIVRRCYDLHTYWGWSLDDELAFPMFRYFLDMFRSRKFANLRHEPADFPEFMLRNNWDLIYEHNPSDTAYMLFWKLLVRALRPAIPNSAPTTITPKLAPKLRKLLHAALPVGSLPFSKDNHPSIHDLSMLFNRLSAMAIVIYLESQPAHRITQARSYVNFASADDTARSAVIRGMMNFAIFLVTRKIDLKDIANWIQDMAKTLVKDHSDTSQGSGSQPPTPTAQQNRISLCVQLLLGSIRKIFEAQAKAGEYPDSTLLLSLGPILRDQPITRTVKTALEVRRLCQSLLDSRIAVVSPVQPDVAPAVAGDNQESQDSFQVDVDMNDPAFLAALDEVARSEFRQLDEKLCAVVKSTNIGWLIWEMVRKVAETPPQLNFATKAGDVDSWISCWLGIAAIQVSTNKMTWDSYLKLPQMAWAKLGAEWCRRLHLGTMLGLLRLDPTRYLKYQNASVEALIVSFVAKEVTIENEYLSTWASTDKLQHPLFRDSPGLQNLITGVISQAAFLELRHPFLSSVISTLDERLRQEQLCDMTLSQDNTTYVGFCIKLFTIMQNNVEIPPRSEQQASYLTWCREVFQIVNRYPEVKSHPRLTFWMNWGKELNVS
ncbi:hypothetical protein BDN72DRAFT_599014 [Pluteus cervinus]|uniref:Uncharacterized protein n=1 Tax=Pluteus cervinus TaxID=181527 RepID=A0ACD3BAP6_9AGAR|nr:hypothetical protein BDN72DRAFT_599014 [Pluteus cervinus]